MKKVLFALSFMVGSAIAVNAQDTSTSDNSAAGSSQYNTQTQSDEYTEKEAISADELPSQVQSQLQSSDYTGWSVSESYRKEKDGQTMYAVKLSNGSEMKMVKFDAQGNKIKEKDVDESKKGTDHSQK